MKNFRSQVFSSILLIGILHITIQCDPNLEKATKNPSEGMDIYLLIGQSNMAGRAAIENEDRDTLKNVFLFTGEESRPWEKAANPLNKYSSIRKALSMQRLGPGYSFARKMSTSSNGKKIGLIVNAKGGTSISLWNPGSEFYNEAISCTKEAMKFGTIKGVLWHLGESDASKSDEYLPKLTNLIESLRADLKNPDLPFVAGQLSVDKPIRTDFNELILIVPRIVDYTAVVTTENTSTTDSTHFDSVSQRVLGYRYADKMLHLIQKRQPDGKTN